MMSGDFDRTDALLADIRDLVRRAEFIVRRGRESFVYPADPGDPAARSRRIEGRAIVVEAQAAVHELPTAFRDRYPLVAWEKLRFLADYLAAAGTARVDADVDYGLVWEALAVDLPRLVSQLGIR
ncbi:MAG: hypothetical protein H7311_10140 [Ramlibacter sp.]|nr:hypothetical protein [Cryobacterium sp.]